MRIWVRSSSRLTPIAVICRPPGEKTYSFLSAWRARAQPLQLPYHYFARSNSPTHDHNMTASIRNQTQSAPYVPEYLVGTLCCMFCLSGCFSKTDKIANDREVLKNRSLAILENGVETEKLLTCSATTTFPL